MLRALRSARTLTAFTFASLFAFALQAHAVERQPANPAQADPAPAEAPAADAPESPAATDEPAVDYDAEPPLDWPQREWRWYTRHVQPRRFASRDADTRYGYNPPFAPYTYGYPRRDYFGYGDTYGDPYGNEAPADAYIQGRYDERQFQEWKEYHDKGQQAYITAMTEGVSLFRETRYSEAVGSFVLAAQLNQGDPAARLHAAYSLVAIGNYHDAVLMIRRAMQLQSRLLYLPLSIREEYGPQVDFDAHLQRLRQAADQQGDDPGLWMLLGYYEHFSNNPAGATTALNRAQELAPKDPLIADFQQAARLLTPSTPQAAPRGKVASPPPVPTAAPKPDDGI